MQPTTLWIPSPKPFQQRPKRLSERKSMTIAAGLLCTDGLLICADTEIGGAAKFEQRKIRHGKDDSIRPSGTDSKRRSVSQISTHSKPVIRRCSVECFPPL
jgi:hypothetical protein